MHRRSWKQQHIIAIAALVVALIVLGIESAAAHDGHPHTRDGLSLDAILQVAGTAAAVGLACLLISRIYQHRDSVHQGIDPDDMGQDS